MAKKTTGKRSNHGASPLDADLSKMLGESYSAFAVLADRGAGSTSEWRRRGDQAPGVLKVSQAKRTMYYLQPAPGAVNVTVVLGARATEAALAGQVSKKLHPAIRSAKEYVEGRPVRVVVKTMADIADVEELLAVKLKPGTTKERS